MGHGQGGECEGRHDSVSTSLLIAKAITKSRRFLLLRANERESAEQLPARDNVLFKKMKHEMYLLKRCLGCWCANGNIPPLQQPLFRLSSANGRDISLIHNAIVRRITGQCRYPCLDAFMAFNFPSTHRSMDWISTSFPIKRHAVRHTYPDSHLSGDPANNTLMPSLSPSAASSPAS